VNALCLANAGIKEGHTSVVVASSGGRVGSFLEVRSTEREGGVYMGRVEQTG